MENLIQTATGEVSITLKEITDLINTRHNDSMLKVEKLSLEPSFGSLRKTRIAYNEQGQEIDTYILNKKQAIAVGAKLNNALLMKVIDRVEELENDKKTNDYQPDFTYAISRTSKDGRNSATTITRFISSKRKS